MKNYSIKILIILGVLITLSIQIVRAQNKIDSHVLIQIEKELDRLLLASNNSGFNGSILLVKDGTELLQRHYGWTSAQKITKLDATSRFNIGSLAKEIPGIAILDLIAEDRLSYDDTAHKHIRGLSEWSEQVTISDLLFYKSGLPNVDFKIVKNDTLALEQLRKITLLPSETRSQYLYSNWNNFILSKIVENVTKHNFESWIESKYFKKLGMESAIYDSTVPKTSEDMTRAFSDRYGDDETGNPNFKRFQLCYAPLYMSITDVFKWLVFVKLKYDQLKPDGHEFFKPTTLSQQGALGVLQHEDGKVAIHLHGGASYSFGCSTYNNYQTGTTLILMSNKNLGNEIDDLRDRIIEILRANEID